jgi:hypothetical protein
VFCVFDFNDHGGCQGNLVQALAQWQHPVASSKVLDLPYQVMQSALHPHIHMTIEMASNPRAFCHRCFCCQPQP